MSSDKHIDTKPFEWETTHTEFADVPASEMLVESQAAGEVELPPLDQQTTPERVARVKAMDIVELRRSLCSTWYALDAALSELADWKGRAERQYEYNVDIIYQRALLENELARMRDGVGFNEWWAERCGHIPGLYKHAEADSRAGWSAALASRPDVQAIRAEGVREGLRVALEAVKTFRASRGYVDMGYTTEETETDAAIGDAESAILAKIEAVSK